MYRQSSKKINGEETRGDGGREGERERGERGEGVDGV